MSENRKVKMRKSWLPSKPTPASSSIPAGVKAEIKQKADHYVENILKPQFVQPPPKDSELNYISDIYTKWYRHYLYFCAKYLSPGPYAILPGFETKFARLEYVADNRFNMSYMRHTDQWMEIYSGLSLDECLESIKGDPSFVP